MARSNLNSDYGYYNFLINNSTEDEINAELNETRNMPVVSRMEDWQVGVVRFKLPSVSVPLFIFEDDQYTISFTLGDNTNPIHHTIVFDQQYANTTETTSPQNRFIYYYSSFIAMLNTSLYAVFTTAKADPAYQPLLDPFPEHTAPYFDVDDSSSYLKLYLPFDPDEAESCPFLIDELLPATYIKIFMSPKLYYFFSGFASKYYGRNGANGNPDLGYELLIPAVPEQDNIVTLPQFTPTIPERQMIVFWQDYSTLYLWQKLSRILITTSMPIEQEMIGVRGANGEDFSLSLLTDFEIQPSKEGNQRDYIFFFPQGDIRYSNFSSNGVLRKFDLKVLFQTEDLRTFPLTVPPGFEASLKLQFKRRKAKNLLQY